MASPFNAVQFMEAFTWIVCAVYGGRTSRSLTQYTTNSRISAMLVRNVYLSEQFTIVTGMGF